MMTVYGTLLNHRGALAALGDSAHQPPYKAPPKAPVLYIKPRNTWAGPGAVVVVPAGESELEIGASLGLVFGRTACRVDADSALHCLAGYTIVADISMPHSAFYRPSVRLKARDGFCPMLPGAVPRAQVANPDALAVRVSIDGETVQSTSTADMLRPAARLIADVSDFMTFNAGDVLLLGVAHGAPRARAGQSAAVEIGSLGRLEMRFVAAKDLR
jgi:5-oxopent-3-ene-1,2,5-tricarboxylate decarboxylase / 2-hydroxyhepta-2,4-diene-1,7-dioate isomerase